MATVTVETNDKRYIEGSFNAYRVLLVGAGAGVLVWVLGWLLGRVIIEPIACQGGSLATCTNAAVIAQNIAGIIGAIVAMAAFIRMRVPRALIVVVASLVALWGLGVFVAPLFWLEALAWSAGLYAVAYLVFAYLTRLSNIVVVAICVVALVIVTQVVLRS